ncbi:hypothetical protein [Paraburkholderia sp. RL17-373-BIF-A]|uniref:hypothetical protein n=1 Tax=Paraburkholderia sp. RL17-373-BIF-A TaxID=3031629 RepID=UPI0038BB13F6
MIRSFLLVQVDGSETVMRKKQVAAVLFTHYPLGAPNGKLCLVFVRRAQVIGGSDMDAASVNLS